MAVKKAVATHLRCEYLTNPLAVDTPRPRLSWEMTSDVTGAAQTAYRILAADSPETLKKNEGNLWDSGKIEGDQSLHIHYAGKPLTSCQQVVWKVMIWDEQGRFGRWSKPATFTMGLLAPGDWRGKWIGNYLGNTHIVPLLRKEFVVEKKVKRALFHATALGIYHITLNGRVIHDDWFAPGWTDYKKRLYYRCYDVTSMLQKQGTYCAGAEIGDGWYGHWYGGWGSKKTRYGVHSMFLGQIRLEYEDGTVEIIPTDDSWTSVLGPTAKSTFYDGESVDAQLDPKGWRRPGFDASGWSNAISRQIDTNILMEAYPAEPVRITEELKPVKYWRVAPGKVIYDFGQNFAGRVRLHVKGEAGHVIRMRFGEMVNLDNTLYIDNMRSAICTDTYVMKGAKQEVWEPKFTFHGFRYVELTGCPVPPSLENVTGVVLGSDTTRVGHFECSSSLVNQIYSNAVWTQRANFLEVPTDCPQRDERLG